jgi:1-acyl-sn-glycerol-3-phosphate acyltransferase
MAVPVHVTFLMSHVFHRSPRIGWFYRFWETIPVRDSGEGSLTGAIKLSLSAIREGKVLAIFPEGRISLDGSLGKGQPGIGAIMMKSGAPVVPVAIQGAFGVLPRHAKFPRPGRVRIVFGDPIALPASANTDRRETVAAFTRIVMAKIAELSAVR